MERLGNLIEKATAAWKHHLNKFDPKFGSPYPIFFVIVVILSIIWFINLMGE